MPVLNIQKILVLRKRDYKRVKKKIAAKLRITFSKCFSLTQISSNACITTRQHGNKNYLFLSK